MGKLLLPDADGRLTIEVPKQFTRDVPREDISALISDQWAWFDTVNPYGQFEEFKSDENWSQERFVMELSLWYERQQDRINWDADAAKAIQDWTYGWRWWVYQPFTYVSAGLLVASGWLIGAMAGAW